MKGKGVGVYLIQDKKTIFIGPSFLGSVTEGRWLAGCVWLICILSEGMNG